MNEGQGLKTFHFNEDFSRLLGGEDGVSIHQTLPGFDAIFMPTAEPEERHAIDLGRNEEHFHIWQLRKYRSGWYLEGLQRKFASEV